MSDKVETKRKKLPSNPGVYLFKNEDQEILYIGKAANLKKRVSQYFSSKAHSPKIEVMIQHIADIDYVETATEADALLFEAYLINQHTPRYNTRLKDDKSYPLLLVTKEKYPQLVITRKKNRKGKYFGPYTDASLLREAVQFIHSVFPIRKCRTLPKRACLYYYINQCTGPCIKTDQETEIHYQGMIEEIMSFLGHGKKSLISYLIEKMKAEAKALRFEEANEIKKKIEALKKLNKKRFSVRSGEDIRYTASLELKKLLGIRGKLKRIVCFDISNLMGQWAVASKVSFYEELPDKSDYRRFKIKTVEGINDYDMMQEALRRFLSSFKPEGKHEIPDLIMIDGGKGHLSVSYEVLKEMKMEKIPIVSLAKKFETLYSLDREPLLLPENSATLNLIKKIRDEAHRFAVNYHKKLRGKDISKSALDDIEGIGPKRKKLLLEKIGSVAQILQMESEIIHEKTKIPLKTIQTIKEKLQST